MPQQTLDSPSLFIEDISGVHLVQSLLPVSPVHQAKTNDDMQQLLTMYILDYLTYNYKATH